MKKLLALGLLSPVLLLGCGGPDLPKYAVSKGPTPVLYTPDFDGVFGGQDGITLKLDDYEEIDELEFVALEGTVFEIKRRAITSSLPESDPGHKTIYRVESADYPYPTEKGYYIDSRFVELTNEKPAGRPKALPPKEEILATLLEAEGSPYTWGGNVRQGIESLLAFYPPASPISQGLQEQWMLKGVDCSGLLYEAANGATPRNTSDLLDYGRAVEIAGKSTEEIAALLQPLDLIVWKGHMVIALGNGKTIESKADFDDETEGFQGGVRVRSAQEVLTEAMESRVPMNRYADDAGKDENGEDRKKFVVRRWIGGAGG